MLRSLLLPLSAVLSVACASTPKSDGRPLDDDTGTAATTDGTETDQDTSDTDDPAEASVATRVVLSQQAALLPTAGAAHTLTATVYDQYGVEMADVIPSWESSDDATVAVSGGVLTATGDWGSAQVHASVDGISSSPATVLVADPADGATLVADDAVGDVAPVDPEAPTRCPSRSASYRTPERSEPRCSRRVTGALSKWSAWMDAYRTFWVEADGAAAVETDRVVAVFGASSSQRE